MLAHLQKTHTTRVLARDVHFAVCALGYGMLVDNSCSICPKGSYAAAKSAGRCTLCVAGASTLGRSTSTSGTTTAACTGTQTHLKVCVQMSANSACVWVWVRIYACIA
jgi:hypothetical protein